MATPYSNIYERFSMKVTDYNLDTMYNTSTTMYENYIKQFLISAISNFIFCDQDLTDRNDTTQTFNITLTELEQEILSMLMVIEWCSKEVNSIMELRRHLGDTDFKMASESLNLREKKNLLIVSKEDVDKLITRYDYYVTDLSDI